MSDDSNDEADLLAALNSYNPADAGGSSDSDDDGIALIDTSAVALILAARHSSDAANFGALADALQSVAAELSSVAITELEPTEVQVNAARERGGRSQTLNTLSRTAGPRGQQPWKLRCQIAGRLSAALRKARRGLLRAPLL